MPVAEIDWQSPVISFLREPILSHFSVYNLSVYDLSVYDLSVFMFCLSLMHIIIRTPLRHLSQAEFGDLAYAVMGEEKH